MSFIHAKGAREFFKAIVDKARDGTRFIMFDHYYCCLLAGLDLQRHAEEQDLDGQVFVNGYPEAYHAQANVLAGLLVDAELRRKDISTENRASIEREMLRLLDPKSLTRLSEEGNRFMNLYAAEGFKALQVQMMPPSSVEDFLVAYQRYWASTPTE